MAMKESLAQLLSLGMVDTCRDSTADKPGGPAKSTEVEGCANNPGKPLVYEVLHNQFSESHRG